jgi:Anti-sigma regulatory factor (Ser/Thr protein kinase)
MPEIPFPPVLGSPAVTSLPVSPVIPVIPSFWRLPADPASVRLARRVVAESLPYDGRSQLAGDLGLLTSELVTNAVRYGPQPADDHVVELVLWPADGHYWVAVSDAGTGTPSVASPGPEVGNGRGLMLVESVSDAWTVVPRRTCGKSVVAGIRLPSD